MLELGPAAGHFTKALVDAGCQVVGVEVDPDAAERVRSFAEQVVVGDLSDQPVVASAIDESASTSWSAATCSSTSLIRSGCSVPCRG